MRSGATMAKTTECPQENVGVFRIRARQGQGDTGNGPRLCAGAQTRKRGGRHIRTFPRNSGRRGKYTLKEESNRAYSPKCELESFGRSSTTKLKTTRISPFAEQRRGQAEIVTCLGTIPPTLHNIQQVQKPLYSTFHIFTILAKLQLFIVFVRILVFNQ